MENIEFTVGLFYKTRQGDKAPFVADLRDSGCTNTHCMLFIVNGAPLYTLPSGQLSQGNWRLACNPNDIIGPWEDPHYASDWPENAEVVVWNEGARKPMARGHFAKVDDGRTYAGRKGKIHIWQDGRTSFTKICNRTEVWDCAELFVNNDDKSD